METNAAFFIMAVIGSMLHFVFFRRNAKGTLWLKSQTYLQNNGLIPQFSPAPAPCCHGTGR